MNTPVRSFGTAATAFRAGPGGSNLKAAAIGAAPATDVTTTMGYGTGTGSRQVIPLAANTTAGSAGASATGKGFRDESYAHTNQATNPTLLSGAWSFVYSLAGGTLASTVQMTVVVYAVTAANATRELFRNTSGNISVSVTEANFTHTFTPADQTLAADEILQYEFFLNVLANGNTVTGTTIAFRAGAAGSLLTVPSLTGGTIIAQVARATSDSVPTAAALGRVYGAFRARTETLPTTDALARSFIGARGLAEILPTADTIARVYGAMRAPATEALPTTAALARVYNAVRPLAETNPTIDALARSFAGARAVAEAYPIADAAARQFTAVRAVAEYPPGVAPDFAGTHPGKAIAGKVTANSAAVAGAVVKLFRESDDKLIATTTSAADGTYSFSRDVLDPNSYYVLAYLVATPQQRGVSDRDLVPA